MALPAQLLDQVLALPEDGLRELRSIINDALPIEDDWSDLDQDDRRRLDESAERALEDLGDGRTRPAVELVFELRARNSSL